MSQSIIQPSPNASNGDIANNASEESDIDNDDNAQGHVQQEGSSPDSQLFIYVNPNDIHGGEEEEEEDDDDNEDERGREGERENVAAGDDAVLRDPVDERDVSEDAGSDPLQQSEPPKQSTSSAALVDMDINKCQHEITMVVFELDKLRNVSKIGAI